MVPGEKPGWFFSIPQPEPQNPADGSPSVVGRRVMMQNAARPHGAVINLNPSCFGEVYWIGGNVGGTYMAFAVWLPYEWWVSAKLPIIVHFRPNYEAAEYREATQDAKNQRVPEVLARDKQGRQQFLDAAWYYFLGPLAFVQQMIAVRRLAILVMPIPPTTTKPILHPDAFFKDFVSIIQEVVSEAINQGHGAQAGRVTAAADGFILTGNSHGGTYLMKAARMLESAKRLKEVWMFDTADTMGEALELYGVVRRLYFAQRRLGAIPTPKKDKAGVGNDFERQGADWSVVDISGIPAHGQSLHDFCARLCFSHAVALISHLANLNWKPRVMNETLDIFKDRCWLNRLEFWRRRANQ
jgi:hypothetical protein